MKTKEIQGITHELTFWKQFVTTERFLAGWVAPIITPELHATVRDFISSVPHDRVLDVGSGVVSILNGLIPASNLTAADPLGGLYDLIFDYDAHGLRPPLLLPAEELGFFQEFDIVHISNAIDHTQNPEAAFNCLLAAVKPGGHLIVQGFENEADFENYAGFHQHNLSLNGESLVLVNPHSIFVSSRAGVVLASQTRLESGRNWIIWICRKEQ